VAASFLLRPNVPAARWPWLPLLAGVASAEAIERSAAVTTSLKWPNDVLVDGHKLGGVLVERIETPGGPAAVVGIGINVLQRREELPAGATSLALAGASASREVIVHELGHRLARWYAAWRATAGDPSKGLATTYVDRCHTLGNQVRVILPGGSDLTGKAVDVDKSGRLIVDVAGSRTPVGAGDVIHVRMRDQ
jgi:BirA family biotin operon repressor/biotin-[acetyl-CoA-carboxylase] ligase